MQNGAKFPGIPEGMFLKTNPKIPGNCRTGIPDGLGLQSAVHTSKKFTMQLSALYFRHHVIRQR